MAQRSCWPSLSRKRSGCSGTRPQARSTASGNLAGWAVDSTTMGVEPSPLSLARGGDGDGGMRIDEHACLFHQPANGHLRLMLTDRMRG